MADSMQGRVPELDAFPTGRDGPLADMLRDMTPLERGALMLTCPPGIVPALIADLQLPVAWPVKQTVKNGG